MTLPEMVLNIRKLARRAYPGVTDDMLQSLARDQFIDALDDTNHKWFVKQSRPMSLEDAERTAIEYEAFQLAVRGPPHAPGDSVVRCIDLNPVDEPVGDEGYGH